MIDYLKNKLNETNDLYNYYLSKLDESDINKRIINIINNRLNELRIKLNIYEEIIDKLMEEK